MRRKSVLVVLGCYNKVLHAVLEEQVYCVMVLESPDMVPSEAPRENLTYACLLVSGDGQQSQPSLAWKHATSLSASILLYVAFYLAVLS